MDDIVKQALAKWPNVPDCYGWLGLDARGRWYLRDDATQAAGPFPQSRGQQLLHDKLLAFIARNYEADAEGQWFFQNGPQRVYVELEATPWVWRLQPEEGGGGYCAVSHTGCKGRVQGCLVDAEGRVYFALEIGVGLVHTLDVALVAQALEAGQWALEEVRAEELPARFGYVQSPSARREVVGRP